MYLYETVSHCHSSPTCCFDDKARRNALYIYIYKYTSRRIERGGQRKVTQNAPPVLAMKFSSITAPKRASERAREGAEGQERGHLNANLSKAEGRRREGGKGESVSPLRDLRSTAPRETTCQPYDDRDRPRVVFSHADPSPHMLAIIKSPLILHASTDSIVFSRPFALPVIFFLLALTHSSAS